MEFEKIRPSVELLCFDSIRTDPVDWLWYPFIPMGKITILQGDPGEGKTTLALQLAALVSRGMIWGSKEKSPHQHVIYQTAEDGLSDTVKPRLEKAQADCSHVHFICEGNSALSLNDSRLEEAVRQLRPALVILDPLQAFLGADVDMHRANEIRPVMTILAQMAQRYHCAVVLIGHMNKKAGDKSMYRGLGSIDLTASARSVLLMARDPEQQQRRVLIQVKSSLAPEGKAQAFDVGGTLLMDWMGDYEGDLKRLFDSDAALISRKQAQAEDFLQTELAGGERISSELLALAKEKGISKSVLGRARHSLGVISTKRNGIWYCRLPGKPPQEPDEPQEPEVSQLPLEPEENSASDEWLTLPSN
jgi:RecA/RadA recombinase